MLNYILKINLNKVFPKERLKVIWITFRLLNLSSLFYLKKGVREWQEILKVLRLNCKVMCNR
nr:MAG TPA: hypothetical protein [Caudoviricetes sp.]